ncbi:MAG: 3D domain-containing protein [Acidobacteria bacterium]|nr:3D domain-containing protein [Acidobacteriota bacterium]
MTRHLISRSLWRKLAATCIASAAFVLLYDASIFDSRDAAPRGLVDPTLPAAGSRLAFTATAYCKGSTTASGVGVRTGIAASDPALLPVGSVVNLSTDTAKYNGVYTIMDTGPRVQGRVLDIYMWSCHEALAFGRRAVDVTVLRLGWNPNASTPSLVDRLFRRREAARAESAKVVEGASGANSASDGATFEGAASEGAAEPSTGPSHFAPSDAPSHLEPSSTIAPVAAPQGP